MFSIIDHQAGSSGQFHLQAAGGLALSRLFDPDLGQSQPHPTFGRFLH